MINEINLSSIIYKKNGVIGVEALYPTYADSSFKYIFNHISASIYYIFILPQHSFYESSELETKIKSLGVETPQIDFMHSGFFRIKDEILKCTAIGWDSQVLTDNKAKEQERKALETLCARIADKK
jgi:hypothetical protein